MFRLFLFYLINKFVNVKIGERIAKYCVSQITMDKSWDGVDTIQITLKSSYFLNKEYKIDVDKDLCVYP